MTERWDWTRFSVWTGIILVCLGIWALAVIGAVCLVAH